MIVMGDVNMDYVVRGNLPFRYADLVESGTLHLEEIDEKPGGSALNLCYHAKDDYETFLLGKVGRDTAGSYISSWLEENGIEHQQNWVDTKPTGKTIICRDRSDIRLMVNNINNANHALSTEDINVNKKVFQSAAVLYISGYCFNASNAPRVAATKKAIELAKSENEKTIIVFDVVPHRIYQTLSFSQFQKLTKGIDLLISEVHTMRRFLDLGSKEEEINKEKAIETLELLKGHFTNLILRYGPSGCDHQLMYNGKNNNLFYEENTGHNEESDKRGFGDKLSVSALNNFF